MNFWSSAAMPVMRRLDPETAHRLSLQALRLGLAGSDPSADDQSGRSSEQVVRLGGMT